ncbi:MULTISPECIES: type I-B CRISPR-associated protein Cas7/Csh2 [Campylobacter]|uniref:Type I-B CRISPR-associated protein Cas7/Csh2 n=1 Tax=Campylobacter californiensis TaxID=1032243 RepID=A0ABD4JJR4_9BACT|nr:MULTISPECIES: type I-B CRISPR-associated protein Cas7/Csh2 [unclassified Campylobacter]MBE2986756.1 type I-B CRISPR-associated protein Cas7/Csh2 [Campylobacter sp. RM12919]MBE2988450.1 type I-B CRISPR-associated protein Cas7/Csh2 [Campylobacter sp. RM12920]MBE3610458.1 type I-B CRISPR-associated protein Cas7/Csh2 [Campylobacter sp. RM12916]
MKKKEILFLWDGENFNPNGDMLRENAPRIDDETNIAEVTDVRIKRTIRDEIMKKDESIIFVKEYKSGENILDCKSAVREVINIKQEKAQIERDILSKFIDIRAFGGVLPISDKDEMKKDKDIKTAGVQFTGAVQFRMSRSLHRVQTQHIKGTGAFASGNDKGAKTFREEDFLSYAMFATYGIFDNNNAKNTNFSEDDAREILSALWNGTKNLITRSKMGQTPRFMLIITYKDDTFAGDLNNSISLKSAKSDEAIRNINDYTIDFSNLNAKLQRYAQNIEKIEYVSDFDFEKNNKAGFGESWQKIGL